MKKNKIKYEHKAATKDYLRAIINFPKFGKLLIDQDKTYHKLLEFLIQNEIHFNHEDTPWPTIKELSLNLGISASRLTSQVREIYEDILSLNSDHPKKFVNEGEIQCYLSFKYFDSYQGFNLGLKMVPRKGERFHFGFIEPKIGCSLYHVANIYHDWENGGHTITINFTTEYPNQYLNLIKEKAYLRGEISFWELIDREIDSDLEKNLVKMFANL